MTPELIGPVLGCAAAFGALARLAKGPVAGLVAAPVAASLALVPIGGDSLAAWVLAVLGPASGSALVWFALIGLWLAGRPAPAGTLAWSAGLIAIAALLYPSAMGYAPVDVHALGFAGPAVPALLVGLAGLAVWRLWWPFALHVLATGVSVAVGLHGSANLFDHLIDVPSVLLAAGVLIAGLVRRLRP